MKIDSTNWRNFANCLGTDPEAFYPEKGGSTREAKRVCANCPIEVRRECLEDALRSEVGVTDRFGIRAGTTPMQRRKIAQQRREEGDQTPASTWREVKPCGTAAAYRRHKRRGEPACEDCLAAEARRAEDQRRKGQAS